MRQSLLVLLLAVIAAAGVFGWRTLTAKPPPLPTRAELLASLLPLTIETNDGAVKMLVEVAADAPARSRGLQGRRNLATKSGMLFVFDAESIKNFWMKETLLPLDILWINAGKKIIGHDTMLPCEPEHDDDPCPITSSPPNTLYALEVYDQFVEEHNIEIGNTMTFTLTQ